jgi:hypothetical protein
MYGRIHEYKPLNEDDTSLRLIPCLEAYDCFVGVPEQLTIVEVEALSFKR